jgi:signal peptidase I
VDVQPGQSAQSDQSSLDEEDDKPRLGRRIVRDLVETVLIAALIYVAIRSLVLPYEVEGASMNPNLHDSDRLLVSRQSYAHVDMNGVFGFLPWVDGSSSHDVYPFGQPERGDVIVFKPPVNPASSKPYVKRIIGLPGERITFERGYVYVDGVKLNETYIDGAITSCDDQAACDLAGVPVPDGMVFVLGDNRQHSTDSRSFGFVDVDSIIGEAIFTNWPIDDFGPISGGDYDR